MIYIEQSRKTSIDGDIEKELLYSVSEKKISVILKNYV